MAGPRQWAQTSVRNLNLPPRVAREIVLPHIVQFVVVIVLTAKYVEFVIMDGTALAGTRNRTGVTDCVLLKHLRRDGLTVGHCELGKLIYS